MAQRTIAVLATLDTKGAEARFVADWIEKLGSRAVLVDMGVLGEAQAEPGVDRARVAELGGSSLAELRQDATRERAQPVMVAGAIRFIRDELEAGRLHGVIGMGGLQGTAACCSVMGALPYGLPKVMVSTAASGDTSNYVGIKDITMMFSVGDILGLNSFTRRLLANAAGAVHGMAQVDEPISPGSSERPLIGISNLGVLTEGTMRAVELFAERGYETVVFHAIGSGGRAMEQLMREGVIGAVFDYSFGEIADDVFGVLRAGGPDRLTVAGELGLPQVLCPGGSEHLGILVPENTVPEEWEEHEQLFHSPVVFVPRLRAAEYVRVAQDAARRLQSTRGNAVLMLPLDGTSRYSAPDGPLRDTESDAAFFAALKGSIPSTIEVVERPTHAEDPDFVSECVERLVKLIERA